MGLVNPHLEYISTFASSDGPSCAGRRSRRRSRLRECAPGRGERKKQSQHRTRIKLQPRIA